VIPNSTEEDQLGMENVEFSLRRHAFNGSHVALYLSIVLSLVFILLSQAKISGGVAKFSAPRTGRGLAIAHELCGHDVHNLLIRLLFY